MKTIPHFLDLIESKIAQLDLPDVPANLYEPIRYILEKGGKRIRPLLVLSCYSMYADNVETALTPAVGLEVFHNFTLLHDDIMDKADLRRNRLTVHKKWNENIAILSGDAAMVIAYDLISEAPASVLREVIKLFNKTALEVCEGQQYDMDFEERKDVGLDEYMEMIRLKTSVLLAAAMKMGAMMAGAPQKETELLYQAGINLGLAFQLQDDYLDTFGDTEVFGKKTGNDILEEKKTFLLINAYLKATPELKEKMDEAFSSRILTPEEKVKVIKDIFVLLGLDDLIMEEIDKYYQKGINLLSKVKGDKYVLEQLITFFEALKNRNK